MRARIFWHTVSSWVSFSRSALTKSFGSFFYIFYFLLWFATNTHSHDTKEHSAICPKRKATTTIRIHPYASRLSFFSVYFIQEYWGKKNIRGWPDKKKAFDWEFVVTTSYFQAHLPSLPPSPPYAHQPKSFYSLLKTALHQKKKKLTQLLTPW